MHCAVHRSKEVNQKAVLSFQGFARFPLAPEGARASAIPVETMRPAEAACSHRTYLKAHRDAAESTRAEDLVAGGGRRGARLQGDQLRDYTAPWKDSERSEELTKIPTNCSRCASRHQLAGGRVLK